MAARLMIVWVAPLRCKVPEAVKGTVLSTKRKRKALFTFPAAK